MSSAFEKDASFPVLLAVDDAGSIRAIGVGASSLRKRPNNPPLFFFSFSAVASPGAGCCCGGGAHSSVCEGVACATGDSCVGAAGPPPGSALFGSSLGFAVGAHAFAGTSLDAGGGVVHDPAGLDSAGFSAAGAPPPGARHQSVG